MREQTKVWVLGVGAVLATVVVLLVLNASGARLAIGDSLGTVSGGVRVTIHEPEGGVSQKTWTLRRYADCTANMPGYTMYPAGVPTWPSGRPLNRANWSEGNAYEFSRTVYATGGFEIITEQRPRQHPGCVEVIREFARTSGVNITEVVTVTNDRNVTTVERVYVNQTVFVCEDGRFTTDSESCRAPVAVAKPYGPLARFWAWLRGIFA